MLGDIILTKIPHTPGVYLFKNSKGKILYIGKAKDLKKRVSQYFNPNSVWKQDMLNKANTIDFFQVRTESEALYLEDNLIKTYQPPFNNLLKGANSYSYIKITNEAIPRIFITRKKIQDGATYIGPKHNIHNLKKLLHTLRQVLKFRTCNQKEFNKTGYCNDYYFGMCEGWGKKWKEDPKKTEKEYQKIINIIIKFFKGDTQAIKNIIREKIQNAIQKMNFEWAARLRDVYLNIENLTEKQTVVLSKNYTGVIFLIKKIAQRHIVGIHNFFEGKIIDVIVNKFDINDVDQSHIITLLENEFGNFYFYELEQDIIGYQKKQVTKTILKEANALLNNTIESYIIASAWNNENIFNDILTDLQNKYHLNHFPYHIECIDISHLGGSWTSGGLSTMIGGVINKKHYRKYKIQSIQETGNYPNDYLALKEVITRRFSGDGQLPNLFILDGGKGQLNIIKQLLDEWPAFKEFFSQIDFIALGKGEARQQSNIGKISKHKSNDKDTTITEEVYFFDKNMTIQSQALNYDATDKILIKIRNEAHRFANQYRKKQMSKEWE